MKLQHFIGGIIVIILIAAAWNTSRISAALDSAIYAERLRPLNEDIASKDKEILNLKKLRRVAESKTLALKLEVARLLKVKDDINIKEVTARVEAITATDAGLLSQFEHLYGVRAGLAQSCR